MFWQMKVLWLLVLTMLVLALAYRIHVVMQRPLPAGLPEAEKIRWLDESGRIALAAVSISTAVDVVEIVYIE